jgi:hypothetical protein
MKKVLFAAFTVMCILSSIMATSANQDKMESSSKFVRKQFVNDTVPGRKTDTSRYPKPTDTTSMPKLVHGIE